MSLLEEAQRYRTKHLDQASEIERLRAQVEALNLQLEIQTSRNVLANETLGRGQTQAVIDMVTERKFLKNKLRQIMVTIGVNLKTADTLLAVAQPSLHPIFAQNPTPTQQARKMLADTGKAIDMLLNNHF